jgi:hypothetical protein
LETEEDLLADYGNVGLGEDSRFELVLPVRRRTTRDGVEKVCVPDLDMTLRRDIPSQSIICIHGGS